ncbi:MAG: efflux RND transporter periplasmic adaptor subunit, partial [Planctomycetota bacterium]
EAERTAAEIDRARAQLAEARTRLGYATITAPIDGVVASVSTQQGETIAAGLNAPTFVTIIDLARLQVDAYVDEIDIGALAVGQTATFTVDAYPGHTFTGRITAINPTAVLRDNVVSYVVEIAIEQPADDAPDTGSDADADDAPILRPEMTAAVTIATERLPDALVLPARAIHRRDGTTVVHRLQDGTPRAVPVTIGRQIGGEVQLLDGVAAGDTVLLDPPQNRDTP